MSKFDAQIEAEKQRLREKKILKEEYSVPVNPKKGSRLILKTILPINEVFTVFEWETGFLVMETNAYLKINPKTRRVFEDSIRRVL